MTDRVGCNLSHEQMDRLVRDLQETTDTLAQGLGRVLGDGCDEDDITVEDCRWLDERIFNCEACGWWCGVDELSESSQDYGDELICEECDA